MLQSTPGPAPAGSTHHLVGDHEYVVPVTNGAHGLRVRVHVHADGKLRSVRVQVNGRTVRTGTKPTFVVRVPTTRLRKGANRIVVSARDAGGGSSVKSVRFRLC